MAAFVTASAGFLLAVLWFDLMFDVQARRGTDEAVESISTYYARVTRSAAPMNRLVALAMLGLLSSLIVEIARGSVSSWAAWLSLTLALPPIVLAGARTVPAAVRLGQRTDPIDVRKRAAIQVLRQHVFCFACIGTLLVVQLASVGT